MRGVLAGWVLGLALCPTAACATAACSAEKLAQVRSAPAPGDGAVLIDCDLTLSASDVITRSLYFNHGAVSDGVTVDCAGALLSHADFNADLPRINVQSYKYQDGNGTNVWEPTRDITVKNCRLQGNINVTGMGGQDTPELKESSHVDPNHTAVLRARAPTRITFDALTIDPEGRIAVYVYMGATAVTVRRSLFIGSSKSTAIYLDAESGFNRIEGNRFETTTPREVIAIDGSSGNVVQGNVFPATPRGGIFIYRNCGEAGTVRHNEPLNNDLLDNQFLDPRGPAAHYPHIAVASRNGNRSYCEDDAGYPYGSSIDNLDEAHFTAIKGNFFDSASPTLYFGAGPNYVIDNVSTSAVAIPAADGFGGSFIGNRLDSIWQPSTSCFWRAGAMPMLLRDGEWLDLDLSNPQAATCATQRLACNAGQLVQHASACDPARIVQRHFKCAMKNSDAGCTKALACTGRKRLQAIKARCNLEAGPIDTQALATAAWNTLAVDRASDVVSDGHCIAGGLDIATGATQLLGFPAVPASASCRESDPDGGDCMVEGDLVCY